MAEDKKLVSVKIYLEEEKRSRFKATCALENLSMNEVLLGLLEDWLEKHALPTMTGDRTVLTEKTPPATKAKRGKGSKEAS